MTTPARAVPMHDPEAEAAVLSACLRSAKATDTAYDALDGEDFYVPNHKLVWRAITACVDSEVVVDLVTVGTKLRELGHDKQVGGPAYLAQLAASSLSTDVSRYLRILKGCTVKRNAAKAALELHQAACDPMCPPERLAEFAEVAQAQASCHDVTHVTDVTFVTACHSLSPTSPAGGLAEYGGRKAYGSMAAKVEAFVKSSEGMSFTLRDVYEACDARTAKDKNTARAHLRRMSQSDVTPIRKEKNSSYRYIDVSLDSSSSFLASDVTSLLAGEPQEFKISLPLGLDALVRLFPKNLILVAGVSSTGKTAILLDIARRNMAAPSGGPHYLMSEMCGVELAARLKAMPAETAQQMAKACTFVECERDFDMYVKYRNPDGINIIDYLNADGDNFLYVSQWINDIHLATKGGVNVIAIQKLAGKTHGVGGGHTESKPRLYLTLDKFPTEDGMLFKATIVKAKFPRGDYSLDGMSCLYTIKGGYDIQKLTKWRRQDDKAWSREAAEHFARVGSECPV